MPRQVMRAAALAALAALPEAAAFTAPTHSLALKTSAGAFCARSQPVSGMGRRAERRQSATALKMELLGKRYWMWNASEWMFDKFVALTQVVVFTLYGVITRLFESPYDEARLKAIRRRIAELRASREMSEPRNALDMMDVVWEVGAADEKVGAPASGSSDDNKPMASDSNRIGSTGRTLTPDGAVDAPSMDPRMAFSFALVSIPVLLEFISYVSDDLYLRALGSASVWFVGLCVFVDWAAGSPGGVATQVKRVMPVGVRKTLNAFNPRTPYFTEEAESGRRGGDEGLLTRPPNTESNGLW